MIARELISERLNPLRYGDSVETAIAYLVSEGVSELPIIENKKVVNYGRLELLSSIEDKNQPLSEAVAQNPHTAVASENQHLFEMIPILAANQLSIIAVIDENGIYKGLIEQKEVNKLIAQSLTYRGIGAVIVIESDERDFSPATISRWIEENGAKVVGLMVTQTESRRLRVNLKLNTTFAKHIVQTLNRQGYRVEQVYLSQDNDERDGAEIDLALKFFDL